MIIYTTCPERPEIQNCYFVALIRFYFEGITGSLQEGISASLNNEFHQIKIDCDLFSSSAGMSFCSFFGGEVFKDHFKTGIVVRVACFFLDFKCKHGGESGKHEVSDDGNSWFLVSELELNNFDIYNEKRCTVMYNRD